MAVGQPYLPEGQILPGDKTEEGLLLFLVIEGRVYHYQRAFFIPDEVGVLPEGVEDKCFDVDHGSKYTQLFVLLQ